MMCKSGNVVRVLAGVLMTLAATFASDAMAQAYPTKPIRLIVGFAAGGGTDISARLIAAKLSQPEYLGRPVVVENRVGASGNLALDATAKARPDGYTLLFASTVTTAGNASLFKEMPMDVRKDIVPIVASVGF